MTVTARYLLKGQINELLAEKNGNANFTVMVKMISKS